MTDERMLTCHLTAGSPVEDAQLAQLELLLAAERAPILASSGASAEVTFTAFGATDGVALADGASALAAALEAAALPWRITQVLIEDYDGDPRDDVPFVTAEETGRSQLPEVLGDPKGWRS